MKKILSLLIGFCACAMLAQAEEMNFVTVLSAPVGTFQTLETANPYTAVHAPTTSFGTEKLPDSYINITSNVFFPYLGILNLPNGDTTIQGDLKIISTPQLRMGDGVSITVSGMAGGDLVLEEENQPSPIIKARESYISQGKVRAANIDNMYFYDVEHKERTSAISSISRPSKENQRHQLLWSNQYTKDCVANSSGVLTCDVTPISAKIRALRQKEFVLKAHIDTDCSNPPEGTIVPANKQTCIISKSGLSRIGRIGRIQKNMLGYQYRSVDWNYNTCKYDVGEWGRCYSVELKPRDFEELIPDLPEDWLRDRIAGDGLIFHP